MVTAARSSPTSALPAPSSSTSNWLPDQIITQAKSTATAADPTQTGSKVSTSVATSLPSSLPKYITPSGGLPDEPEESQLIQIGFDYSLNYEFVVSHPLAVAQIFQYLPQGLAYGLYLQTSNITMGDVEPYESENAGYIVSVAKAYIPKSYVGTLKALIHTPTSRLYKNPQDSVAALMNLIDPSIPLIPGDTSIGGGSSGGGSSGSSGNPSKTGSDSNDGGNSGNGSGSGSGSLDSSNEGSSKVDSKTVGIGVGAVAGTALYVGAIFIVTKKYRKKRDLALVGTDSFREGSAYRDSSSINSTASPLTSQTSSGGIRSMMSGHNSNGGIGHQISEPVMSVNSLGWS